MTLGMGVVYDFGLNMRGKSKPCLYTTHTQPHRDICSGCMKNGLTWPVVTSSSACIGFGGSEDIQMFFYLMRVVRISAGTL